jgi:hypothetical protein
LPKIANISGAITATLSNSHSLANSDHFPTSEVPQIPTTPDPKDKPAINGATTHTRFPKIQLSASVMLLTSLRVTIYKYNPRTTIKFATFRNY